LVFLPRTFFSSGLHQPWGCSTIVYPAAVSPSDAAGLEQEVCQPWLVAILALEHLRFLAASEFRLGCSPSASSGFGCSAMKAFKFEAAICSE